MVTYAETIQYLYQLLPVFHRDGKAAYKPGLGTIQDFCKVLGNPQQQFKSVHVAGTNGKGSTSHWLAAILQLAGYRVGLYTSPHLKDFRERIRINGTEIAESYVVDFVEVNRSLIESRKPSFFEVTVAMAFQYFADEGVDIAIIEVGVGGRLDSTNVIQPEVSVITTIGWDHTDLLGDTLEKIAFEKAGIIKPTTPIVVSENQESVLEVFREQARLNNAPLFLASDSFSVTNHGIQNEKRLVACTDNHSGKVYEYELGLLGLYQLINLKVVLKTVEVLRLLGWKISDEAIGNGLGTVVELTGLKGRWQKIGEKPLTYCDTAHNESGIREVIDTIKSVPHTRLWILFGVVRDKEINRVLTSLPKDARYVCCQATNPRALPAAEIHARLQTEGYQSAIIPDVNEALASVRKEASSTDLIVITGSTYLIADLTEIK